MKGWQTWTRVAAIVVLVTAASRPGIAPLPTRSVVPPHLGYGVNLRHLSNIASIFAPLDYQWIKVYERFDSMPTEQLPYYVLYRIDISHGDRWLWMDWRPHRPDLDRIRDDVRQIAQDGLGLVDAYEIGNEPNMDWEWMDQPPDPADYVAVLQVAYDAIKEVDPGAIVVSGGLGPVGRIQGTCTANSGEVYSSGNNCSAMDEREYAREMLSRGAGDYFDAFGYHPCGFAYPPELALDELPEHDNGNGFAFRGAEVMHGIMEEFGLGEKPIWATEFGWLRDPSEDGVGWCHGEDDFAGAEWFDLPEVQQADYLTRAFQYADENWPWMGAMFVWALDFQQQGAQCWPGRFFSVRKDNGTEAGAPTLAYSALAAMPKRHGHFGPRLAVEPAGLTFLADVDEPDVFAGTLTVLNTGYQVLTWTVTVAQGMQVTPTLAITTGLQGTPLRVTVDSTGYVTGTFTGAITVTATTTDVLDTPQTVPITLLVVPEVYHVYLPATLRSTP